MVKTVAHATKILVLEDETAMAETKAFLLMQAVNVVDNNLKRRKSRVVGSNRNFCYDANSMSRLATFCHSREKVLPNRRAGRFSGAQALANSENILPLQDFERSEHWFRFFPPVFPVSVFDAHAVRRCFSRIASDVGSFLVCAQAFLGCSPKNANQNTRLYIVPNI